MKCPYRADHMCVFEVDGVVNHNVSSKILHQNLSAEGWKGVFLSLLDFLAAQIGTFFGQISDFDVFKGQLISKWWWIRK